MSRNSTPLTTRPASTSRHGMIRLKCTRLTVARAHARSTGERCERFADAEAPLVQRLADDHAVEAAKSLLGAKPRKRLQVRELADAARQDHVALAARLRRHFDIALARAIEHSVVVDVRVDEVF